MYRNQPKVGILGGGQLGKMLCMAAMPWHLEISILDKNRNFPAAPYCHFFSEGDFTDFHQVLEFGKDKDIITIEIEGVNSKALHELKEMGKKIFPDPDFLDTIKDKARQNTFFQKMNLPGPIFESFDSKADLIRELENTGLDYPFVWKSRFEGYDGKGVKVIHRPEELNDLPETPCIAEELVDIKKELAIIVSRNANGQIAVFDPVEMKFDLSANLLDQLVFPADIDRKLQEEMKKIAESVVKTASYQGILAIEFFLDQNDRLLVNEVAPRPHNSGHHTIECCATSQYEQHLRTILNLPPGNTQGHSKGIMFNLLGEPGYTGPARIEGLEDIFTEKNARLHWYGKKETRPYRKMGHVVLFGDDVRVLSSKADVLKTKIKIKS